MKKINVKVMYIFLSVIIPTVIMLLSGIVNLGIGRDTAIFLAITTIMYIVGCVLIYPILNVNEEFLRISELYENFKNDESLSDEEKYDKFMIIMKKSDLNLKVTAPLFNEFEKTLKGVKMGVSNSGEAIVKYYSTNDIEYYFDEDNLIFKRIHNRTLNQLIQALTAVGMFGTFLGIVKGVSGLNLENSDAMRTGIQILLSGVKTSFNSSLYGILFSVILTFSLKIIVDMTMKKACKFSSDVNSLISPYTEQSALSDLEEELKSQTGTMQKLATDLAEEMGKKFNESIQNNLEMLANNMSKIMSEMQDGFSSSLNKSMAETMIQITGTLQPVMEKLESTMNKLESNNQKTTDKLFEESISSIKDAINIGTNNEVARLQESMNAISEKNSEMLDTFMSSMENMKELTKYQESLVKNTTDSTESMNITTENIKTLQQDLSQVIVSLKDVNSTSNLSLNNIKETVDSLKSSMEKQLQVNASIETMLNKSNKLGEAQGSYINKFENLSKVMINNIENTQNTMNSLNEGMNSYKNYFDNIKNSTAEVLNLLDNKYKSFTNEFENAGRSLTETADSIKNNLLVNVDAAGKNLRDVSNNLNDFQSRSNLLINRLENFTEVEKSTQDLWSNYKNSFEKLNETINDGVIDYTKSVYEGTNKLFTNYDERLSQAVVQLTRMTDSLSRSTETIAELMEAMEKSKKSK